MKKQNSKKTAHSLNLKKNAKPTHQFEKLPLDPVLTDSPNGFKENVESRDKKLPNKSADIMFDTEKLRKTKRVSSPFRTFSFFGSNNSRKKTVAIFITGLFLISMFTCLVTFIPLSHATTGTTLFSDSFTSGSSNAWSYTGGSPSFVTSPTYSGAAHAMSCSLANNNEADYISAFSSANPIYFQGEFYFTALPSSGVDTVIVALESPAYAMCVGFELLNVGGTQYVQLLTANNGYYSHPDTLSLDTWYNVTLEYAQGTTTGTATLYINGATITSETGQSYTAAPGLLRVGSVSAQGYTGTVNVDNIVVSTTASSMQTPVFYQSAYATDQSNGNPPTTTADVESSINAFVTTAGKGIYLYNVQSTIYNDNDPSWIFNMMKPVIQAGLCQGIMVDFLPISSDSALTDSTTIAAIAAGTWNSYFTTFANEAKAFGYPIYLRIGAEMNICQGSTTWNGAASFGENPTTFIAAWQDIYNVFQTQGASNVYFVWNPNYNSNGPKDLTSYYPGNNYVNWIGIDMFQESASSDNIPSMINEIYSTYSSQKPIMIAETGIHSYTDAQCATWINNFFATVRASPDIQMICYQYGYPYAFTSTTLPLTTAAYENNIANQI